jgi:hypothetical protein
MTLSMYQASVPVFQRQLGNLSAILKKAEADAEARKIDPSVFLGARLAPDMFALARQVQIATDMAKGCVMRLSGAEVPKFEDDESTFADLEARIRKTLALIAGISASQIDGSEEKDIVLKFGQREMVFRGQSYLLDFVLPNLFFHLAMVYAILRHNGVALGKTDFVGAV